MKKWIRRVLIGLAALILLLSAAFVFLGLTARSPGDRVTPAGFPRNQALHLSMRDGVEIAVDVWLPADLEPGEKVPAVMRATRYWRAYQMGFAYRVLLWFGAAVPGIEEAERFNDAGFSLVLVDARGSGASFGSRPILWSDDEVADYGEVAGWIASRPWSNGRVGAYGVSYDGNTAEFLTVPHHPAVRAVAPQYSDFDPTAHLVMPGGVFNTWFLENWSRFTRHMDRNDICAVAEAEGVDCFLVRRMITGVKKVDGDRSGDRLADALADRDNVDVFEAGRAITFADDRFGKSGRTVREVSPAGRRPRIESSGVPMFVWCSWIDAATADGALSRFLTFSNPQRLIIGPWSHGGEHNADPFLPPDAPTDPAVEEQQARLLRFFNDHLAGEETPPARSEITFYTLGAGTWETVHTWPPPGVRPRRYLLAAGGSLAEAPEPVAGQWPAGGASLAGGAAPAGGVAPEGGVVEAKTPKGDPGESLNETDSGFDTYSVDYTATTGDTTRWHTQMNGRDVIYPDRAAEDGKLLTYTSAPLAADLVVAGSPVVTLHVASSESDTAFHVYLEDVAPDGRVTYVTEGLLRARHRRVSDEDPPYAPLGPYHSCLHRDDAPLVPGEVAELTFSLFSTAARFPAGHRLRLALAGHDASVFQRYPARGTPVWTLHRSAAFPSAITLPVRSPDE